MSFNSDFDRQFDRMTSRATRFAGIWFAFVAILTVGVLSVVGWALVRVVLHFT